MGAKLKISLRVLPTGLGVINSILFGEMNWRYTTESLDLQIKHLVHSESRTLLLIFFFIIPQAAWEIFTPLLHRIDNGEFKSIPYKRGSRGPEEADELLKKAGYVQTHGYVWTPPTL